MPLILCHVCGILADEGRAVHLVPRSYTLVDTETDFVVRLNWHLEDQAFVEPHVGAQLDTSKLRAEIDMQQPR